MHFWSQKLITLFRSITMFYGTDNIPQNISTLNLNMMNDRKYSMEHCQSHQTLLWIWIMLSWPKHITKVYTLPYPFIQPLIPPHFSTQKSGRVSWHYWFWPNQRFHPSLIEIAKLYRLLQGSWLGIGTSTIVMHMWPTCQKEFLLY